MKLRLLLLILAAKLRRAAGRNRSFREFIRNKKARIVIRTAAGGEGRLFVFDAGKVSSRRGTGAAADAAMVWTDAGTGYRVMSSGDEEATIAALTERKLVIEGDYKQFLWFSAAVAKMSAPA